VFEYTLMSAALKDPEPQARLNRAIAADPDLTQRFMNVLGGSASFRTLFNARDHGDGVETVILTRSVALT
jgi:hypothetical protein